MIKDNLEIAIIQSNLYWENINLNLEQFEHKINSLDKKVDIIVLPEMFSTGFTQNPESNYEESGGKTMEWMLRMAIKTKAAIAGSIVIKENSNFYNRFIFMKPDATWDYYDKRHLFRMGNEHKRYTAGNRKVISSYLGWNIRLLICYDLRFPVWSRNRNDYDVLIYVANWPAPRQFQWHTLLTARAIENQSYVIAANRTGNDGNNNPHSGDSLVINPLGQTLAECALNEENILFASLSYSDLMKYRENFPVRLDADEFEILV